MFWTGFIIGALVGGFIGTMFMAIFKTGKDDETANLPTREKRQWIKHNTGHSIYYACSRCGCVAPCTETADKVLWKMANYCPDCGAKMEEEGGWKMESGI